MKLIEKSCSWYIYLLPYDQSACRDRGTDKGWGQTGACTSAHREAIPLLASHPLSLLSAELAHDLQCSEHTKLSSGKSCHLLQCSSFQVFPSPQRDELSPPSTLLCLSPIQTHARLDLQLMQKSAFEIAEGWS